MQIRVGYELKYSFPQPTPLIVTLNIHYTRVSDIVRPDHMVVRPAVPDVRLSRRLRQLVHAGCVAPAGQAARSRPTAC